MPPPFKAFVDAQTRFRDTDAMGHVNNAVYLSFLELARMHYWIRHTGVTDHRRIGFILARVEIDYRSPAYAGEELRVWLRVTELRGSSFVFAYRVEEKASGRLVAEAVSVQAGYDYEAGRVRRLTEEFRGKVLAFEEPGSILAGRAAGGRRVPPSTGDR